MVYNPVLNKILEPIRVYFKEDIKELVMNKPQEILLETIKNKWLKKYDEKLTLEWFRDFIKIMASYSGQDFHYNNPLISFRLPEGHRVQVIYGRPYTKHSMLLSIRLFRNKIFTLDDYIISAKDKQTIAKAVKKKHNILIAGGTGTGKTSFLNTLLSLINKNERIVTLEGVSELKLNNHNNWASIYYDENSNLSFGKNTNISEFLNTTLRLRPDRIIFGELKKENCFAFIRAINTGHKGSMATIHANSPEDVISAIKENIIMNGDTVEEALAVLDEQLRRNLGEVIQLNKYKNKIKAMLYQFKV